MPDLRELLTELAAEGLLVHGEFDFRAHLMKRDSLLVRAASQSAVDSFLSNYDALMRLAEAVATHEGYRFGESPHLAMKKIVQKLDPSIARSNLDLVASERHKAKKSRVAPSAEAVGLLGAWNKALPLTPLVSELFGN